jgi:hypothetical protein
MLSPKNERHIKINIDKLPEIPNKSQSLHPTEAYPIFNGEDNVLAKSRNHFFVNKVKAKILFTYMLNPNRCVGSWQEIYDVNHADSPPQSRPKVWDCLHFCIS